MPRDDADRFDPPAPVAEVTLSDPATGARCDHVRMLIDPGADISVVPRSAVNQLRVEQAAQYEVAGFGEGRSTLPAIDPCTIRHTSRTPPPPPIERRVRPLPRLLRRSSLASLCGVVSPHAVSEAAL